MRNRNHAVRRNVRNNKQALVENIMAKIRPIVEKSVNENMKHEDMNNKYTVLYNNIDVSYNFVLSKEIENGYLHDTYNNWGKQRDEYEAGDYVLGNSECDYKSRLESAISDEFELDEFELDYDGTFDEDGLSEEVINGIKQYIKKFADENEHYTEATYYNYWDGSNHQSIIIDTELDYDTNWEIVEDEVLLDELFEAVDNAGFHKSGTGFDTATFNDWTILISHWQDNPFSYEIFRK